MQDLNYQLKILCRHSREGRERQLTAIANQLHQLGYRRMGARSLKPKHVEALVQAWLQQGLNPGTIKNRMSCLRWWAEKVHKQSVVARSNDHYGIPDRKLIGEASKARELTAAKLELIKAPYVRTSLRGISFGNFLIKQVVMRLKEEMPQLAEFAILSPIPGFRTWLNRVLVDEQQTVLGAQETALLTVLDASHWYQEDGLNAKLQPLLMQLCARYLVQEKRGSTPLDPVARFHLGNGASIARINWLGDVSAKGLQQSAGLLVNYEYDLEEVEEHHEAFLNRGEIACAAAVRKLLANNGRGAISVSTDGLKAQKSRSVPLISDSLSPEQKDACLALRQFSITAETCNLGQTIRDGLAVDSEANGDFCIGKTDEKNYCTGRRTGRAGID